MGLRGPAPKPTAVRILNGMQGHRPLPAKEPQYMPGVPDRPAGMSPGARKVWSGLVAEMAPTGVLRLVDSDALAMLCEDCALLATLRKGLQEMANEVRNQAKAQGKKVPGGPMVALSRTIEGRRTLSTIAELAIRVTMQRREFGLTPASNSRVEANNGGGVGAGGRFVDPLEAALCGSLDEPRPN